MANNSQITEAQLLRKSEDSIRRALPADWTMRLVRKPDRGGKRPDALLSLTAPGGEVAEYVIEAKRSLTAQTLLAAIDQLTSSIGAVDSAALPLIAAGYLSPRSREVLSERGISHVDTTGNLRLSASRPGLFVEMAGATKDPWPDDQPLRSLGGRGASRAVRALVDFRPPYGVRELAARAHVPPATISRVSDLLARDAVLTKDERGGIAELDWVGVIRRWSQDYELRRSNLVTRHLDPRGLPAVVDKLGNANWRYAATTSLAAQSFAPIAPTRTAVIYVEDAIQAADRLKLLQADAGANVLLVEPFDDVVFERTMRRNGLTVAALSQVAADLLTGPGREPSEGEELLIWMKDNEDAWRA